MMDTSSAVRASHEHSAGIGSKEGVEGGVSRGGVRPSSLRNSLIAAAVTSCLLFAVQPGFAQSANSNLRGYVSTDAGPAAETEVVATNVATGAVRRTRTAADGSYVLIGLPPGTYTVTAGGNTSSVTLSVASNATLNLAPATEEIEQVVVTGSRPAAVDVRTSEVGNTISLREIAQLPQSTRNFLEFADTVPGMAFTTDAQGFTSLRSGATSKSASNLYIDGVGQKSYVEAGGIAGQNQTRGNPFPQLAIGEYKVITSNYKAEYGQVAGAAVTAVTRSGTNEFEVEAYVRYTDEGLRSKRPDEKSEGARKVDSQTEEYGFAVGGPIIEDRLFYFLAYEYKDLVSPRTVFPNVNASDAEQYLPAELRALFGPQDVPFEEDLAFGKLSWQVTDDDLIDLSIQYRDEVQVDTIGGQRSAEHGRDSINKDQRMTLRWQRSTAAFVNELLLTMEDSENNPFPRSVGNGLIYAFFNRLPDGTVQDEWNLIEAGPSSGFDAQVKKQEGWSIANNITFPGLMWLGEHTIKLGASYKDIELTSQDAGSINPQFRFEVMPAGVSPTPYRVDFLAPFNVPGQRATVVADAKQYGVFVQDDWAVNDKLIVNLGVRWDYEKNPAYTDFVTSPDFVAALYSDDPANPGRPWADRLLPSGLNAANYISTGNNRDDYDGAIAPRFGIAYDLNADERHVIHGGAGRSYDRNLFKLLSLEVSKAALSPVAIYFQDPGTGLCYRDDGRPCLAWDPNYLAGTDALLQVPVTSGSAEIFLLNNRLKTPYTDQFSIGMANQIGDWRTDFTVQRLLAYDGFIFTLINRYPDGSFFQNGSQPWGEPVPGYANSILGNNGIESRNTQLLLSAEKPYSSESRWSLNLAYTYTEAKHNRKLDDNYAFDQPTIDRYPFIRVDGIPKHRFVAAGSIDGPWDTVFGVKLVLETPRPMNEVRDYGARPADGSYSQAIAITPPGTGRFLVGGKIWGYRTVDFQATKRFQIGDFALTARMNVLNAFDFKNYSTFNILDVGSNGQLDPDLEVNRFGDIYYVPRTLSFELSAQF
jgi:outer membrane receptor protein involved in Fe transport